MRRYRPRVRAVECLRTCVARTRASFNDDRPCAQPWRPGFSLQSANGGLHLGGISLTCGSRNSDSSRTPGSRSDRSNPGLVVRTGLDITDSSRESRATLQPAWSIMLSFRDRTRSSAHPSACGALTSPSVPLATWLYPGCGCTRAGVSFLVTPQTLQTHRTPQPVRQLTRKCNRDAGTRCWRSGSWRCACLQHGRSRW